MDPSVTYFGPGNVDVETGEDGFADGLFLDGGGCGVCGAEACFVG